MSYKGKRRRFAPVNLLLFPFQKRCIVIPNGAKRNEESLQAENEGCKKLSSQQSNL
jgi:hypothetical protein